MQLPARPQPIDRARPRRRTLRRRGAVLVEFALVALVLYVLLAATVELGRALLSSQGAQAAADVAARELALAPLPASLTFDQALDTAYVRERIYDPAFLAIDVETQIPDVDGLPGIGGADVDAFFAGLPIVNRALRPLMTRGTVDLGSLGPRELIRYPGALLVDPDAPPGSSGLTVAIPEVVTRGPEGEETIRWRRVLEEVRADPLSPVGPADSPFSALSPEGGLVAVRVHVPYQAAALGSYRTPPAGPGAPNLAFPNVADDQLVQLADGAPAPPGELIADAPPDGVYGGPYGLGRLYALGTEVRPFRRLFAAQALQRRELPLGP
jgi:hypothetical protein